MRLNLCAVSAKISRMELLTTLCAARRLVVRTMLLLAACIVTRVSHADLQADRARDELTANDIIWTSIGETAAGSMPIGDGTLGANVWVESNGDLVLLLSHTDAFSEAERLLKLGRVRISCDPPLEVASFVQRMSFAENAITITTGVDGSEASLRVTTDAATAERPPSADHCDA